MTIEHIAVWTNQLEAMKTFYVTYFNGVSNEKYVNEKKKFSSYFISFESGARLELMHKEGLLTDFQEEHLGIAHFAFSLSSKEKVDALTNRLRGEGVLVVSEPRRTGDGYYESIVEDPDGNYIEITI